MTWIMVQVLRLLGVATREYYWGKPSGEIVYDQEQCRCAMCVPFIAADELEATWVM